MTTDTQTREIIFVDSRVQDVATLLKGLPPGAEVVVLNAGEDGLQQMAAALGERGDVGAVHVLAHGSEGQLLLGNTVLGSELASHSVQLDAIGRAMTPDGDLLVYACDVGAGAAGAQFVSTLAQLTGADVAVSTDLTGAAALGGNWALEAHEGKIDAKTLEITGYQDVLTLVHFNGADADYSSTTIVEQVNGRNFTFSGGAAAGGLGIDTSYGSEGVYAYEGPTDEVKLTITAAAGYSFDLNSFDVGVQSSSLKIDLTYANGTTDTLTVNSLAGSWQTLFNAGLSTPINDVKRVVFSSSEFGLFQNFDITDVKLLPPLAQVNSASLSVDTAPDGATNDDFITSVASQTISGTLSAILANGGKVEVSYDDGSTWNDATTYTVGSNSWSTTTTLAGSDRFVARVSNADSSSAAYSRIYQVDDMAPVAPSTPVLAGAMSST
ncbi:MAG: DUF4347 domain-containing protein [Comamonadaceae bacterium]|nr:MAG: DUF4347 domain-containing protein [Comamonadaceae bacterium]